jgi:hypothetical protein
MGLMTEAEREAALEAARRTIERCERALADGVASQRELVSIADAIRIARALLTLEGERFERHAALEVALRDLVEVCRFATFDNGVTAPDGRNEADYWAAGALDQATTLLQRCTQGEMPEPDSMLACRLKCRLDALLEKAGSESVAITSRGIGISYLFAREIYHALLNVTDDHGNILKIEHADGTITVSLDGKPVAALPANEGHAAAVQGDAPERSPWKCIAGTPTDTFSPCASRTPSAPSSPAPGQTEPPRTANGLCEGCPRETLCTYCPRKNWVAELKPLSPEAEAEIKDYWP